MEQRLTALQGFLGENSSIPPGFIKIPLGPEGQEGWEGTPWGYKIVPAPGVLHSMPIREPGTVTNPLTGEQITPQYSMPTFQGENRLKPEVLDKIKGLMAQRDVLENLRQQILQKQPLGRVLLEIFKTEAKT